MRRIFAGSARGAAEAAEARPETPERGRGARRGAGPGPIVGVAFGNVLRLARAQWRRPGSIAGYFAHKFTQRRTEKIHAVFLEHTFPIKVSNAQFRGDFVSSAENSRPFFGGGAKRSEKCSRTRGDAYFFGNFLGWQ